MWWCCDIFFLLFFPLGRPTRCICLSWYARMRLISPKMSCFFGLGTYTYYRPKSWYFWGSYVVGYCYCEWISKNKSWIGGRRNRKKSGSCGRWVDDSSFICPCVMYPFSPPICPHFLSLIRTLSNYHALMCLFRILFIPQVWHVNLIFRKSNSKPCTMIPLLCLDR